VPDVSLAARDHGFADLAFQQIHVGDRGPGGAGNEDAVGFGRLLVEALAVESGLPQPDPRCPRISISQTTTRVLSLTASAFLLRIFTARASLRSSCNQDRPAAFIAIDHGFAQHAPDQRAAAPTAAGTGADSGAFADLLKSFRAGLNRFEHGALADLVAQACGFEVFDDRLFFGFAFQLVDGAPRQESVLQPSV